MEIGEAGGMACIIMPAFPNRRPSRTLSTAFFSEALFTSPTSHYDDNHPRHLRFSAFDLSRRDLVFVEVKLVT